MAPHYAILLFIFMPLHLDVQLLAYNFKPFNWHHMLLIKSCDVQTNPDPTTTHKQVWICDISHKQIHCREHISIR